MEGIGLCGAVNNQQSYIQYKALMPSFVKERHPSEMTGAFSIEAEMEIEV